MGETYRVPPTSPPPHEGSFGPARSGVTVPSPSPAPGTAESYAEWLGLALAVARRTVESGDVPVGAIVVDPLGVVVGRGRNAREAATSGFDPTAHAEVVALRAAARSLESWRLDGCTLAVTLEPCPMCAGALMLARVSRVVFGAWDPKLGACGSVWDIPRDRRATHRAEVVGGIREAECAALLLDFFAGQRGRGDAPGAAGPAADDG